MADSLGVPDVVSEVTIQVQEANVLDNLQRIQAFLESIVTSFNQLNTETQQLPATRITVDKTNFTRTLRLFTGTNAQELFDYIDTLDFQPGSAGAFGPGFGPGFE